MKVIPETFCTWWRLFQKRVVPDEGYSRNVPDEGYSRNVPDEGYSRNVPDEGYSRNVPDEGYSRNVPDECYSRNVPDEGYSRNALYVLHLISMFLLYWFHCQHVFCSSQDALKLKIISQLNVCGSKCNKWFSILGLCEGA